MINIWNYDDDYFLSGEHIFDAIYFIQSLNDMTRLYFVVFS